MELALQTNYGEKFLSKMELLIGRLLVLIHLFKWKRHSILKLLSLSTVT